MSTTSGRRAQLHFALRFAVLGIGFLSLVEYPFPDGSWLDAARARYLVAFTRAAAGILALWDPAVHAAGFRIEGRFPMIIGVGCDASDTIALFSAAVLAYPAAWKHRLAGLALGVSGISLANLIRLGTLYFIGAARPDVFDVAHHDVWPLILLTVAALGFVLWARWAEGRAHAEGSAPY